MAASLQLLKKAMNKEKLSLSQAEKSISQQQNSVQAALEQQFKNLKILKLKATKEITKEKKNRQNLKKKNIIISAQLKKAQQAKKVSVALRSRLAQSQRSEKETQKRLVQAQQLLLALEAEIQLTDVAIKKQKALVKSMRQFNLNWNRQENAKKVKARKDAHEKASIQKSAARGRVASKRNLTANKKRSIGSKASASKKIRKSPSASNLTGRQAPVTRSISTPVGYI